MRFSSVVSTVFGLCIGTSLASTQQSNLTTPQLTQRILTGDFKPAQVFENTNVVRTINLEKGYVRETTNVVITNTDNQAQTEYYVPFEYDVVGRIGGFDVRDKKHAERGPLDVTVAALADVLEDAQGGFSPKSTQYYIVHLTEPLPPKGTVTLSISYHILGALRPLPATIKQEEKQYLTYNFSAYIPSVYPTIKQKTKVKFPSADIPEYTTTEGLITSNTADPEKQGSTLTYGPYETAKVPPGTIYPVTVRYEFNKPVLVCSVLERDVEVSHWGGNLATEERYWLRHDGAKLANQFSRLAWSTQNFYINAGQMTTSALRELKVPLKPGSVDAYFTDEIGNVSTSRFRPNAVREASLELRPRYPLFGGWNYSFRIGWNNDLSSSVRKLQTPPDTYILSVPLVQGPKSPEGIQYEKLVFRVILPEGATNVKYQTHGSTGVPVLHAEHGLHKTFMDTLGRTELVLTATNVVDEARDVTVLVTYEYSLLAALRKPLTVFIGVAIVFVLAYLVGSVDTSIGKKKR
ncbi:dolichyl-diphosphooligosaccharide--protein glycosyltransferase subunit 1 [Exophiala dermatitidis]|uniref:Dolichyl-diphosphooligosaccharide--protein glycosyltransferase subunit 1 n=1 Tax=Exophiala dermatitidis TaxID=5970 RepID=A0AAN6EVK6_EXODE|nr:dolichyl-diphosphooligosaccharide--protein glycosyltransferase subunit 1 [Exophiala dermatitidis]KAJ4515903.1 dolichyl-diphosphooligosaccharide--protein glycosyltransferase subunit 1 [Exophiala dermatitidis]KAJ4518689.1 dolichyl-diphosphooligosaccharide--protein glycosyltransferase subunit 1 [Exophiala dermatitidis]KAJ4534202.1 dolichyl-diphosphooligosaccharide--protein glycosyltransferase subunit 1 [Exophiala dermatitidis]KAJ4545900.1 dolichyl-diphosphooligosaccharide--protein glycosyltrans